MPAGYVFRRPWTSWRNPKDGRGRTAKPIAPTPPVLPAASITAKGKFGGRSWARSTKQYTFRRPWWAWGYNRNPGIVIQTGGGGTNQSLLNARSGFAVTAVVTRRANSPIGDLLSLSASTSKDADAATFITAGAKATLSGSGKAADAATSAAIGERDTLSGSGKAADKATVPNFAEVDALSSPGNRTARATTAALAEVDSFVNPTASRNRVAGATLAEVDSFVNPTAKRTRVAGATLADLANEVGTATRAEKAADALAEISNEVGTATRVEKAVIVSQGVLLTEGATANRTEKAATTLAEVDSFVNPTASRVERVSFSFVELSTLKYPTPSTTQPMSSARSARRVSNKTYVFRRPWGYWGRRQSPAFLPAIIVPSPIRQVEKATSSLVSEVDTITGIGNRIVAIVAPAIGALTNIASPGNKTSRALIPAQGTVESIAPTTVREMARPSATLAERDGYSIGPVTRNERAAQTLAVRETAAEVPKDSETAHGPPFGQLVGMTGAGKRTTAATISRNFGATANATSAGKGGTWRATIGGLRVIESLAASGRQIRKAAGTVATHLAISSISSQIFHGAASIGAKGALIVNAAKVGVIYCYTFISANGEAVTGSGKETARTATTIQTKEAIASPGTAKPKATSTVATKETVAASGKKTAPTNTSIGARLTETASSVVEHRLVTLIVAELDQIAVALSRRVEKAAAFISGLASLATFGKRTAPATIAAMATKETEAANGKITAKPATTLATKETESATARVNARPIAALGANAKVPTATFRVHLTAAFAFVANVTIRSPGKVAAAARSAVGSLLRLVGIELQPVISIAPGDALRNDHPRVRTLEGLKMLRSLRLDHPRNRSLP